MNIDANAASGASAPAHRAGTVAARAQAGADAGGAGAGALSFLSMLHALTAPQEAPVTPVSEATGAGPATDGGQTTPDAIASGAQDALVPGQPVPVATAPVPAPAGHAAETAARAPHVPAASAGGGPAHGDVATGAAGGTDDAQAWQAAAGAPALADARKPAAAATAAAADSQALARQELVDAAAFSAHERAGRADLAAADRDSTASGAWRPLVAPQAGANAASVVSMFEAGLAGLRAGPAGRAQERGAGRGPGPADAPAQAGFVAWSDAAPAGQVSQPASPVYAPTAATPAPAVALAQKMHFWVAGGVQSAQLQLDAFEGGAVDVHIAVKGDEAFVEFRSDQAQARRILLDAMPHLEDLLAGEGLSLSGGFVGGSGQETGDGAGARADRFAGTRPDPARVVAAPAAAPGPARAASGSAVDLFV